MTAAARCQMMTVTIVNIATGITVRNAAHTVKSVIPQSVWVVLMSAPHAMNRSAGGALPNARNVKRRFVWIV